MELRNLYLQLDELSVELGTLRFSDPVTHVYDPLRYARQPIRLYFERYAGLGADTLLLGMNPGPWGMAQTGIPFGSVAMVRDWLGLEAEVGKPENEHPKRPVEGFACEREEVSGRRLWGWARDAFGAPERFFARLFVHNYCPLIFLKPTGANLTPDKLRAAERQPLLDACDRALRRFVEAWAPRRVIGVGAWAESRARHALEGLDLEVHRILHPSPASPTANRGWAEQAENQLREIGVELG
ncbi:MAG: hypothetical protein MI919_26410 [Holophagales bacterium]|nr:hypothetical protein [Holophagales bacterium]